MTDEFLSKACPDCGEHRLKRIPGDRVECQQCGTVKAIKKRSPGHAEAHVRAASSEPKEPLPPASPSGEVDAPEAVPASSGALVETAQRSAGVREDDAASSFLGPRPEDDAFSDDLEHDLSIPHASVRTEADDSQAERPPPPPPVGGSNRLKTALQACSRGVVPLIVVCGFAAIVWLQWAGQRETAGRLSRMDSTLDQLRRAPGGDLGQSQDGQPIRLDELDERLATVRKEIDALRQADVKGSEKLQGRLTELDRRLGQTEKSLGEVVGQSQSKIAALLDAKSRDADQRQVVLQKESEAKWTALDGQLAALARKTAELQAHLDRLSATLQVPPDGQLSPVLIVIDTGQQLAEYGYRDVYQALAEAVRHGLRSTPRRPLGLLANRGAQTKILLVLEAHFAAADWAPFRQVLDQNTPTPGEESDRLVGLQGALDLLAGKQLPCRLVHVTYNPLRESSGLAAKQQELLGQLKKMRAELWSVQLLRAGEVEQPELVQLAVQTGGQHVAILAGRDADRLPAGYSTRSRLIGVLCQSLDLPLPVGP